MAAFASPYLLCAMRCSVVHRHTDAPSPLEQGVVDPFHSILTNGHSHAGGRRF